MKTKIPLFTKIALGLIAVVLLAAAPRASAVPITFSGGSGTPLSFSLAAPVSYTITAPAVAGSAPLFIIQNTGNLNFGSAITGSITFSINGGLAQTLTDAGSGFPGGVVTANDLLFARSGASPSLSIGDVVTLTAGTWTTDDNIAAAAPGSGNYTTFLIDDRGNLISANGVVSTPEALSTLWLALPLIGGMVAMRRRSTA